jgi:periplasmic protein TonB
MLFTTQENRYHSQGYAGNRLSPAAVTGAVGIHALVILAAVLMPPEIITKFKPPMFPTTNIPVEKPKSTPTKPLPRPEVDARSRTEAVPPKNDTQHIDPILPLGGTSDWPPLGSGGGDTLIDAGPVDLPHPPVFVAAGFDPRAIAAVQPPYPGAMVRQEMEGTVTVRVHITAQGTVDRVERINATTDAFWEATRKQALSRWRFRPATLDGIAIESERVMTVHFRLT